MKTGDNRMKKKVMRVMMMTMDTICLRCTRNKRILAWKSQDSEIERQVIPQLDPDSEDTLTGDEEASSEEELVQEEVALEEREPDIQSPESQSENNSANEQYHRPVRERRAPRVFTYDQLGNPGCYSTVCPSNAMYWYLPTHYGTMQATHGWPTPVQHANFQPVVFPGY